MRRLTMAGIATALIAACTAGDESSTTELMTVADPDPVQTVNAPSGVGIDDPNVIAATLPEGCAYPESLPRQGIPTPYVLGPTPTADVPGRDISEWVPADYWNSGDTFLQAVPMPILEILGQPGGEARLGCFLARLGEADKPAGLSWGQGNRAVLYGGTGYSPFHDSIHVLAYFDDEGLVSAQASYECDTETGGYIALDDGCGISPGMLAERGYTDLVDPNDLYQGDDYPFPVFRGQPMDQTDRAILRYYEPEEMGSETPPEPVRDEETLSDGRKLVTYTATGLLDDAVSAQRLAAVFAPFPSYDIQTSEPTGGTEYRLRNLGIQYKCARGDRPDRFTTGPCP